MKKASSEEEREKLFKILNDASEWLEFESDNASTKQLNDKTKELATNFEELYKRVHEHRERPQLIKTLEDTIEHGNTFLAGARNLSDLSKDVEIFTEAQLVQLETVLINVNTWKEEKVIEQEKAPLFETPKLTITDLLEKINVLRSQINNLVNIAKTAKHKTPKKTPETKQEETNKTEDAEKTTGDKKEADEKSDENNQKLDAEEILKKLNETDESGEQLDPTKATNKDKHHTEL